jgi:hypothetical protein
MSYTRSQEDIDRHERQAQAADAEATGYEKWASRFGWGKCVPSVLLALAVGGYAWSEDFDVSNIWQNVEENVFTSTGGVLTALVLGIVGASTYFLNVEQKFNAKQAKWERNYARGLRAGEYW